MSLRTLLRGGTFHKANLWFHDPFREFDLATTSLDEGRTGCSGEWHAHMRTHYHPLVSCSVLLIDSSNHICSIWFYIFLYEYCWHCMIVMLVDVVWMSMALSKAADRRGLRILCLNLRFNVIEALQSFDANHLRNTVGKAVEVRRCWGPFREKRHFWKLHCYCRRYLRKRVCQGFRLGWLLSC